MSTGIFIFGDGGHARVIADIISQLNNDHLHGVIALNKNPHSELPYLGSDAELSGITKTYQCKRGVIAIGDNYLRSQVYQGIIRQVPDFQFPTLVHPGATIANKVALGAGTVVMPGAIVGPGCTIEEHCIINTGALLDHDGHLGPFSSLGPGAVLGGSVRVGEFSALALGAKVLHGVQIGCQSVVGAGSLVTKDTKDNKVYYGTPAKPIRNRTVHDTYL